MAKIEKFKPKLKYGRIFPQGDKLLYETEKPLDQIILPIEVADFLLLCTGEHTVADIIETIYHNRGSIQFKSIYKTLLYLKDRGFLENGDELEIPAAPSKSNQFHLITFSPLFELPIGKRIFNEKNRPTLFYAAAMGAILMAILSFQLARENWFTLSFFELEGSFFRGILFFFIGTSVLLSLKGMLKCLLLIFLTGRAYNFSVIFNGFSLYFRVKSDSLFLISNRLYLVLFHLAVTLCYFPIIAGTYFFTPNLPYANEVMSLGFLLFLLELNPFQESESNHFLRTMFNDDNINKIANYLQSRPLLQLIHPFQKQNYNVYHIFVAFAMVWSSAILYTASNSFVFLHPYIMGAIRQADWGERIAALITLSFLMTTTLVVLYNTSKVFYVTLFSPVARFFSTQSRRQGSKKIDFYNRDELMSVLETLPLFNYFSSELLGMILTRSELKEYKKGAPVIVQGDDGHFLYILLNGSLEVIKKSPTGQSKKLGDILPTSIFGEVSVIEATKRTANVVATETALVLEIPARLLRQMADNSQYIRELNDFHNAIIVNQFFSSAPFFRDLDEPIVHMFVSKGKIETFAPKQIVFQQGDRGDGFHLILRGSVGVIVNGLELACIQQGGFFGETSMITDVPRTATVYALEPLQTLKIGRDAFWEILSHDFNMAMFIESVGEMRIREDIEILRAGRNHAA